MKQEYFYLIRHKSSNRFYAGSSYKKTCDPSQFWITYFTSSKIVNEIILCEGSSAFEVCFISVRLNNDAREFEAEFLNSINAANDYNWINRSNGSSKFRCDKMSPATKAKIGLAHTGKVRSDETKAKMSLASSGKSKSLEHRIKMSLAAIGKTQSIEHKEKLRLSRIGKTRSAETKLKMSIAQKNVPKVTCPHCNKTGSKIGMARYHFDNCKLKPQ